MSTIKAEITRNEAFNMLQATGAMVCVPIPIETRHTIVINRTPLLAERNATSEVFPILKPLAEHENAILAAMKLPLSERAAAIKAIEEKNQALLDEFEKVKPEYEKHMGGKVTLDLRQTPLAELNDPRIKDPEKQAIQAQALMEAFMPIWKV